MAGRLMARLAVLFAALLPLSAHAQDYPEVERTSIYVPVRDGTRLAVNIYRPATANGVVQERLPVIFAFTPYRARFTNERGEVEETALGDRLALRSLIRAGYVVAVADIRGKGASFGTRRGFQDRTEAMDGYDLVEWLADQPFSTGNVGMMGCSYLGGTTTQTASTAPPHLRAIFTGATDWDKYGFVRNGGITAQFNTRPDEPLEVDLASIPVDGDDGTLLRAAVAEHAGNTPMGPLWYGMPHRDSVSPLTGNAFWDEVAIWRYADAIRAAGIATYMWSNWEDEPTEQAIIAAQNLGSRMLIGPGSHCVPPPGFDFTGEVRRYFDYHLKGIDNGFSAQPRVTHWVETGPGEGHYRHTDALPGVGQRAAPWYLGTGSSLAPAPGAAGADRFTVDYAVPSGEYFAFWPAPLDAHGIVYDSAPVATEMDLLGYPVAHIAVQADKPDAEVFAYLEEVTAAGEVQMLSFGRLLLSARAVAEAPWDNLGLPWHSGLAADAAPLAPGETARLAITMQPVSRRIEAGSRLRFVITGADPRQRNLADRVQTPAPTFTILTGEGGSRIDLPLAPPASDEVQIGAAAGTGGQPAIAFSRADAPGYTFYRPQTLPETPMPVVLWGNGGCRNNGLSASHFLREIASHGYFVIANGRAGAEDAPLFALPSPQSPAGAPPPPRTPTPDETSVAQLLAGIDWAVEANASGPLAGHLDTDKVAVMGHSCGGLQALSAGADPRIDAVVAFASGVYNRGNGGLSGVAITKADLARLHTPALYVLGGPTDIAFPNGSDDFAQINHVPAVLLNLPVGHGGTFRLANGGDWARVGAEWLDWQLRGDQDAARSFTGADCRLCTTYGWSIERKGF